MGITGGKSEYSVGELLGQTPTSRLYLCTQVSTNRSCLLQVATGTEHNGVLDRMAFILRELQAKADEVEREFEPHREYTDHRLNYGFGFPEVVESFICSEQGNRRFNVLAFKCTDNVSELVPLGNIIHKDRKRVDLRTSAWILGKALKILSFAHANGFAVGSLDPSGVLIVPGRPGKIEGHYVVLFDWTHGTCYPGGVPEDVTRTEIMAVTQTVIELLGGDRATRRFPDDGDKGRDDYAQHLLELAAGSQFRADSAHAEFYALLRNHLAWSGFHPFQVFDR